MKDSNNDADLKNQVSEEKILDLLWDEFKMRQQHYWRSLSLFAVAIITLWIFPLLQHEVFRTIGRLILIFPVISFLVSILGGWLLGAEYQRMRPVKDEYDKRMLEQGFDRKTNYPYAKWPQKAFKPKIGNVITFVFLVALSLLSILVFILFLYIDPVAMKT